jgi:LAS superfamily LD-carboxypeptidase LdcB
MGKGRIPLSGKAYRLRKEAGDAFVKMRAEALKVGINMYSQSSFRSYDRQNGIWTRKYNRFVGQGLQPKAAINKIIEYSTIPGTSRHHWGTDLDIIDKSKPIPADPLLARHSQKGGVYAKMYDWLQEHAETFGFYEVYTNDHDTRKGFHYEPWHYSYKPLSQEMLKQYLKIDLKSELKKYHLKGIEHFSDEFLEKYIKENVKGINPSLL